MMKPIHRFIRSDATSTDDEVISLIRASAAEYTGGECESWFEQLDLSLDGYGGILSERAARVRELLKRVRADLNAARE